MIKNSILLSFKFIKAIFMEHASFVIKPSTIEVICVDIDELTQVKNHTNAMFVTKLSIRRPT